MSELKWSCNLSQLFIVTFFIFCLAKISYAEFGGSHFYAFPGAWAMDIPDGWISQHHLRHINIDSWRDKDGHKHDKMGDALTGIDNISANQYILKIGYIHHIGSRKQFQFNHLGIFPFADVKVKLAKTAASLMGHKHYRTSGAGDPYFFNSFGWHNKTGNIHLSMGLHIRFPIGKYDKDDPASPGLNRFEVFPAVAAHLRFPMERGLWVFDFIQNFLYISENRDIDYDERDTMESNLIATYYLSKITRKVAFFTQLEYMRSVNDSEISGNKIDDGDCWSFGAGFGLVYTLKPNIIANIKYSEDLDGRQYRMDKATNFMVTWKF